MTTSNFPAEALANPGKIPPGYAIRQLFWDCLLEAERTFGRRVVGWNYRVELRAGGPPMTTNDGRTNVTVYLNTDRSWLGYYFEAAHEAVHCLNPIPFMADAKYLEEAVAAAFSLHIVERNFGAQLLNVCTLGPNYTRACELAVKIDKSIIRLGQQLRKRAAALEYVTTDIIKEIYPDADNAVVEAILDRFPRQ